MYKTVKKIVFALVPRKQLIKHELLLRSVFAFRFKGKKHKCPICDRNLKKFIELENGDLLCPFCGSRARTRRLFTYLQENDLLKGKILHFSPSRSLYRVLKKNAGIDYVSTDFEDQFIADHRFDITNIDCEEGTFDLVVCYHILEHIEEDEKAIRELHRVLKQNGLCLIQTPFKEGSSIYEDKTITSRKDRLKEFGQEDHVRIYSIQGLKERLKNNHFDTITELFFEDDPYLGLKEETVIAVRK